MYHSKAAAVVIALVASACGGTTSPTPTTAPSAVAYGAPAIETTIDGAPDGVAIVNASAVAVALTGIDAARAAQIAFGDGESAQGPTASHVYRSTGTYTITATVTDRAGHQATLTQPVVVRALEGGWYQAGLDAGTKQFESHRLVIGQDGTTLRGSYSFAGQAERAVTGQLGAGRRIRLTVDGGGPSLEGTVPRIFGDSPQAPLQLAVSFGSNSGALDFASIPGPASTAPPLAQLTVSSGVPGTTLLFEGLEGHFDMSRSTGDGLSYFVEFGDGESGTGPVADHAPVRYDTYSSTARAFVVDRFGRVSSATVTYLMDRLKSHGYDPFMNDYVNPANGRMERRVIEFTSQSGSRLTGTYTHPELNKSQVSATLSGANAIHIALDDGTIEFTGALTFDLKIRDKNPEWMVLRVRGGSADGAELIFNYYDPY